MDLAKSLPNPARSHWILDRLGEICPIFYVFRPLRQVSASPETAAHPTGNRPIKPDPNTGRLWVRHLPTQSPTGWLRVGHKLDPLDPWTALVVIQYEKRPALTLQKISIKDRTIFWVGAFLDFVP